MGWLRIAEREALDRVIRASSRVAKP